MLTSDFHSKHPSPSLRIVQCRKAARCTKPQLVRNVLESATAGNSIGLIKLQGTLEQVRVVAFLVNIPISSGCKDKKFVVQRVDDKAKRGDVVGNRKLADGQVDEQRAVLTRRQTFEQTWTTSCMGCIFDNHEQPAALACRSSKATARPPSDDLLNN